MSSKIDIREATIGDVNTLAQLGRDAFSETYAPFNTPQDLARHIEKTYSVDVIRENLTDQSQTYLISLVDGISAGFGLLSSGPSPDYVMANKAFQVRQLYVLKMHQRLRLGSRLIDALAELAGRKGADTIWLTVWEQADWARRFYQRCGFQAVGRTNFRLGSSDQTDLLMTKTI